MVINMKVIGKMIKNMAKELIIIKVEINMMEQHMQIKTKNELDVK